MRHFLQQGHALDMPGLRKEVERLAGDHLVTAAHQRHQITSECRRVAGHIEDPFRVKLQKLLDHLVVAGARRVENELSGVVDVAWSDADRLSVVANSASGARQIVDVVVGGTAVVERGGVTGIRHVAAAPGSPTLVEAEGGVW